MEKEAMRFEVEKFASFFSHLAIPAKEGGGEGSGVGRRLPLMAPQVYALEQIAKGLEAGQHIFWVLKARQQGITTLALALKAYWAMEREGMIFTHIAPDVRLAEVNRALLAGMLRGLPKEWALPQLTNNRVMMEWDNGSRVIWLNANANKGKASGLGQGIGMLGIHGTELGSWSDEDGIRSLMASLAQQNPDRLYIFEGTSKGAGLFKDYWQEADRDGLTGRSSAKAIFVPWWLNPFNRFDLAKKADARLHSHYWTGGRLSRDEEGRVELVKKLYGYVFPPEQLSWWRYMQAEPFKNRREILLQEFPWVADDAWLYGAKGFVKTVSVNMALKKAEARKVAAATRPSAFSYKIGYDFESSGFEPAPYEKGNYDLVIYEPPAEVNIDKRYERLVIACDPTHGANEESDLGIIQVWRAHTDKFVLLAEYARTDAPSYHLVWVLLDLVGLYDAQTKVIVELQGGGQAMHDELDKMQAQIATGYGEKLIRYFEKIDFYRYYRPDAVRRRGVSQTYHWITSYRNKPLMLGRLRDYFERDMLVIHSIDLLHELADTTQDRRGDIKPAYDDNRVMAAAIAVRGWVQVVNDEIRDHPKFSYAHWLEMLGKIQEKGGETKSLEPGQAYLNKRISDWKLGVIKAQAKEQEKMRALASGEWDNYVSDWESGVEEPWPESEDLYGA